MKYYIISVLTPFGWYEVTQTPDKREALKARKKYESDGLRTNLLTRIY